MVTNVETSVRAELATLAKRDPTLADSALAAIALELARQLDDDNSATSKAACARELREAMKRLSELAPEPEQSDEIEKLGKRVARKTAGKPAP